MDAEWKPDATASRRTQISTAASPRQGFGQVSSTHLPAQILASKPQTSASWTWIATAIFCCLFAITACKPTGTLERFQQVVAHADTLWACEIDGNPTLPAEHKHGIRYVFDYEVKLVRPLLATEVEAFRKALQDSTTFDKVNVKSCPMVAKWAIAVRHRGEFPAAMVISPAPCGKALIFDKKHPDKPLNLELTGQNLQNSLNLKN